MPLFRAVNCECSCYVGITVHCVVDDVILYLVGVVGVTVVVVVLDVCWPLCRGGAEALLEER